MIQTQLITLDDIKQIKGISSNLNQVKDLDPHIIEAQEFDLRVFMGEDFYLALIDDFTASPSLAVYSDLWNGVKYEYNNKTYQHFGLKTVLAYYAYARYLGRANVKETPYGLMHKKSDHSERVSERTITRYVDQAQSAATSHEKRVHCFLAAFSADYPLYECGGGHKFKGGKKSKRIG